MTDQEEFQRYRPQYPLPDDLQSLQRSETVCQFCGVSYLIHNEIKNLEDQLEASKQQVETFRSAAEESMRLRAENKTVEKDLQHAKEELSKHGSKLDHLEGERNDLRIKLDDLLAEHSCCSKHIEMLQKQLSGERSKQKFSLEKRLLLQERMQILHEEVVTLRNWTLTQSHAIVANYVKLQSTVNGSLTSAAAEMQHQHQQLHSEVREAKQIDEQCSQRIAQMQQRVKRLEEEIDSRIKEKQILMEEKTHLQMTSDDLKFQLNNALEERKSLAHNVVQLEKASRDRSIDYEQLLNRLQTAEKSKLTSEAQLKELREQCDRLGKENDSVMKALEEEKRLHNAMKSNQTFVADIQNDLMKTRAEVNELQAERDKLIFSHQNRMQQLKDNFQEKLDKVNAALQESQATIHQHQHHHEQNMSQLEKQLKEAHAIELNITKERAEKALAQAAKPSAEVIQLQQEIKDKEDRSRREMASLLEKNEQFEQLANQERLRNKQLQTMVDTLTRQMGEASRHFDDQIQRSQSELRAQSTLCDQLRKQIEHLQRQLTDQSDEVRILRDTVRRECEERYELMDALMAARGGIPPTAMPGGHAGESSIPSVQPASSRSRFQVEEITHPPSSNRVVQEAAPAQRPPRLLPALAATNGGNNASSITTAAAAAPSPPSKPLTNQWTRSSSRDSSSSASGSIPVSTGEPGQAPMPVSKHEAHKRRLAALMSQSMART